MGVTLVCGDMAVVLVCKGLGTALRDLIENDRVSSRYNTSQQQPKREQTGILRTSSLTQEPDCLKDIGLGCALQWGYLEKETVAGLHHSGVKEDATLPAGC